ncbi:hypothetical protein FIU85_04035 [Roseovarius sp. THAF8]|uniref:hypothetical protein n=1 Tax=Roseovarius sp. THAF8 TaxID=2587846 RepID=UPI0012A860FC|nr:hypothetical protein [Roseovarius sp. THAF8]QFT96462.1 hypothetical protein FIU85_04035 [Roseovarius sp. THAF8]
MSRDGGPIFLARRAYFQRRMMDAARLLPVLGAGMFVLPLLWKSGEGARTVAVMFYIFLCWVLLIGLGWIVSRRLSPADAPDAPWAGTASEHQVRPSREG